MSKMNRIRIVNLNYNRGTVHFDDEVFDLDGKSTLLSWRNGGGKTVFVQMITALFVNKGKRDMADRPFANFFTSKQPTFLMVEWKLDHDAGYFLNGMMIRKNQNPEEEDPLEIIAFAGDYTDAAAYNLDELPIVEKKDGRRLLSSFGKCKKELERLKEENKSHFSYYDMSNQYQRRNYFQKLEEYQINRKEWENIICPLNKMESGLSELFHDAKDEKGLVEKWFLPIIEQKMNQSGSRIRNFQDLSRKLIEQYHKNQSSIQRKERFETYFIDMKQFENHMVDYRQATAEFDACKKEIGEFLLGVELTLEHNQKEHETLEDCMEQMKVDLQKIQHEKYSYKIYQLQDEKEQLSDTRFDSEMKIKQQDTLKKQYEKEIALQECAKLYAECKDFEENIEKLEIQRAFLLEQQQETEQERTELGGKLFSYYTVCKKAEEQEEQQVQKETCQVEEQKKEFHRQQTKKQQELLEYAKENGILRTELKSYDRVEHSFCKEFHETLQRNILGEYEKGTLQIAEKQIQEALVQNSGGQTRTAEEKSRKEMEKSKLQDAVIEGEKQQAQWERKQHEQEAECAVLEQEKQERMALLKYIDLSPQFLDEKEQILQRFESKIQNLQNEILEQDRQLQHYKRRYHLLKQGTLLELPEHMKQTLENHGISIMYGMEWLKHNGRTYEENIELVRRNPFLPYSLLLRKEEIERMKEITKEAYTSFPIPILSKEQVMELSFESVNGMAILEQISFYVMFQERLLNPEELKKELEKYQSKINELEQRMMTKKQEIGQYQEKKNQIDKQKYSEAYLKNCQEALVKLKKNMEENKEELLAKKEKIAACDAIILEKETLLKTLWQQSQILNKKQEAFRQLQECYEEYLQNMQKLQVLERKEKEAKQTIEHLEAKQSSAEEQLGVLRLKNSQVKLKLEEYDREQKRYADYEKQFIVLSEDETKHASEWKSRFEILLYGVNRELKDIESSLQVERKRLRNKNKDLDRKNKYDFSREEYAAIVFVEEQIELLEKKRAQADRQWNQAMEENNKLEAKISALSNSLRYEWANMKEKTGYEELKGKNEIVDIRFDERIQMLSYEMKKKAQELSSVKEKIRIFSSAQMAMAEYDDFAKGLTVEATEWLEHFTEEELRREQSRLKHQLSAENKKKEEVCKRVENLLRELCAKPCYAEDIFQKCFDNLISVVSDVELLEKQADINEQAFHALCEKLAADLETIERDKKNLEEFFLEYVKNLDDNMRRIDRNSTIRIRDRSIKMLRIDVPDWLENEDLYKVRIKDFVNHFLKLGMDVVDQNENVEDILGKWITTKNLYDNVVGIRNITIQLYKVEAEREISITWDEVSANSGGEGFLSAFIILSCLLSYMRRDETDLFASGEEGKVLIMDNPFAKTHSEHLLKPLMGMAKKTNTQLICLSGIGASTIYNRFDNIYVLNLVKSGLHEGMEYVKTEHTKGKEIKGMLLSQFQNEQMSLFEQEVISNYPSK